VAANVAGAILTATFGVHAARHLSMRPMGPEMTPASVTSTAARPGAPPLGLPTGKGMWIYQYARTEGGDAGAIVARARATGLTHLYIRAGSWADGFYAGNILDALLPAAHAAGLRVIAWDFPRLGAAWQADVARAAIIVRYTTPDGHRVDGFSADIETPAEGTHVSGPVALAYGRELRAAVGPGYPLIATVPRPSAGRPGYPYAEIVDQFDAIAPMVYWLNRQPDSDLAGAFADLAHLGKPVMPVGQAYDGLPEGGRPGVPTPDELRRFVAVAAEKGASGVSFWSWQAADQRAWDTIRDVQGFGAGGS
jgi:hypothetical protein